MSWTKYKIICFVTLSFVYLIACHGTITNCQETKISDPWIDSEAVLEKFTNVGWYVLERLYKNSFKALSNKPTKIPLGKYILVLVIWQTDRGQKKKKSRIIKYEHKFRVIELPYNYFTNWNQTKQDSLCNSFITLIIEESIGKPTGN